LELNEQKEKSLIEMINELKGSNFQFTQDDSVKTAMKHDPSAMFDLDAIFKHKNHVMSSQSERVSSENSEYFDVPSSISDDSLLRLKAAQYVMGKGRLVKLTDKGRDALKLKWLSSENIIKKSRTQEVFVMPQRTQTASTKQRTFKRFKK
jgi:hypothetical protein